DAAEALDLAEMCRALQQYPAAVGFYATALKSAPALAADASRNVSYDAARCAALASAGKGIAVPSSDSPAAFRRQALDWLKAALKRVETRLVDRPGPHRAVIARQLRRWQQEPNFAPLRELPSLQLLPEAERVAWQTFWAELERVRRKGEEK